MSLPQGESLSVCRTRSWWRGAQRCRHALVPGAELDSQPSCWAGADPGEVRGNPPPGTWGTGACTTSSCRPGPDREPGPCAWPLREQRRKCGEDCGGGGRHAVWEAGGMHEGTRAWPRLGDCPPPSGRGCVCSRPFGVGWPASHGSRQPPRRPVRPGLPWCLCVAFRASLGHMVMTSPCKCKACLKDCP